MERKITVIDNMKPVISGVADTTINIDSTFNLKTGVTAKDNVDGDLTGQIKVIGAVKTQRPGIYTLTYTVADQSGNVTTLVKKITVTDHVQPEIFGATDTTITIHTSFNPKTGVTARDHAGGDLTSLIKVTGTVNTQKPGIYILTYTVVDKLGNQAVVNRKITVK